MRLHGTFQTDTRTRLVGTWEFNDWTFHFWANGSRTHLTGFYYQSGGNRVLRVHPWTWLVGRFTRTA